MAQGVLMKETYCVYSDKEDQYGPDDQSQVKPLKMKSLFQRTLVVGLELNSIGLSILVKLQLRRLTK